MHNENSDTVSKTLNALHHLMFKLKVEVYVSDVTYHFVAWVQKLWEKATDKRRLFESKRIILLFPEGEIWIPVYSKKKDATHLDFSHVVFFSVYWANAVCKFYCVLEMIKEIAQCCKKNKFYRNMLHSESLGTLFLHK